MTRSIFRKAALDKIASLDQLDQTMTVVKPANVAALISAGLLILVGLVWGIFGSVPDVVMGNGVIMNYDSVTSVKCSNSGVVKNVFVRHGDYVKSGQIIARIERQDILDQIRMSEKKT